MSINTTGAINQASRPRKFGVMTAIGGPQFFIAQLFTIIATILGVYLAGYVGFNRTLEYDRFVKAEQQANLLHSLHAELQNNTTRLKEFVPLLERTMEGHGVYEDWPDLQLFIWNASAQSPVLFSIPSQAPTGLQSFYGAIQKMLSDQAAHEMFQRLTSSNTADRRRFIDQLNQQLEFAEKTMLPALASAAAAEQSVVQKYSDVSN